MILLRLHGPVKEITELALVRPEATGKIRRRPRNLNVLPSAKIGAMENSKTPVSLHDFKSKMKYATVKLLR